MALEFACPRGPGGTLGRLHQPHVANPCDSCKYAIHSDHPAQYIRAFACQPSLGGTLGRLHRPHWANPCDSCKLATNFGHAAQYIRDTQDLSSDRHARDRLGHPLLAPDNYVAEATGVSVGRTSKANFTKKLDYCWIIAHNQEY